MYNDKLYGMTLKYFPQLLLYPNWDYIMMKVSEKERKEREKYAEELSRVNKFYEDHKKRIIQTRENEP